jgi:hypothetical protein
LADAGKPEASSKMTLASPKSLPVTVSHINGYNPSPFQEKVPSRHITPNGIHANGSIDTPFNDGSSSDGIQTPINTHASISAEDQSMPIAVIGIGCRFPGDATSPDNFWKLISEGRSAHSGIPNDRFNIDAFYHPAGERQGSVSDQAACPRV